ncbi:MAG: hypothetical protein KBE65_05340 [Phycisphaerae bacterium]|nr:hypothetical protein [Phycisphaerae bacterium]
MKSKKATLIFGLLAIFCLASAGAYWAWEERFWPFCTGRKDEAFLDTTFGMSPQEVRRSLAHHGAQLLSYAEYRKTEPEPSIDTFGAIPVFSDDRREDASLYMSSIEMFDSKVEAEFNFRRWRLASVGVHIDPIARSEAESVVAGIESKLRSTYQFSHREESRDIPGAYTLHFASSSTTPSLWVNLTDRARPIIILTVVDPTTQLARKREIENREHTVFGGDK